MTHWLRSDAHVHVAYEDRTPYGSPVSRRPEATARELFSPIVEYAEANGFSSLTSESPALLRSCMNRGEFRAVTEKISEHSWSLIESLRYPDPALAKPRLLTIGSDEQNGMVRVRMPDELWPRAHELVAELCNEGVDSGRAQTLHPDIQSLLSGLQDQGLLAAEPPAARDPSVTASQVTFCGHNTVVVRGAKDAVLVDPWLPGHSARHPRSYQPLQLAELGFISAVLITHSHPDHFEPGSLLRIKQDTPIVVPAVERETLLAANLESRLAELGFTNVVKLGWGSTWVVGDITVMALPFYGEQPSDSVQLHPEIRNVGNTYRIETPNCTAVVLADSGRDAQGDVSTVGLRSRLARGAADIVFSGYRGWSTYPVQLLFSSVAHFLFFVPPVMWRCRMQLMTDAAGALDAAERFGASTLVPYADGGAPWFWDMGLGPRLDVNREEVVGFDPFPERVQEAARSRTSIPDGMSESTARVIVLRPGESLSDVRVTPIRVCADGHTWPW